MWSTSTAEPADFVSGRYPLLRHVAAAGQSLGAIEGWDAFVARGRGVDPALVLVCAASVHPSDRGVLFFSSGTTTKPKGILSAHRAVAL